MLAALIIAPALLSTVMNVSIENHLFVPESVSVQVGDTVRWTNKDTAPHTSTGTTSGAGTWASANLSQNQTYTKVFTTVGSFPYKCNVHPSMLGKVVTTGATAVRTDPGLKPAARPKESTLRDARGRTVETAKYPKNTTPGFHKTGN